MPNSVDEITSLNEDLFHSIRVYTAQEIKTFVEKKLISDFALNERGTLETDKFKKECDIFFQQLFGFYNSELIILANLFRDVFFVKGTTLSCAKTNFDLLIDDFDVSIEKRKLSGAHFPFQINTILAKPSRRFEVPAFISWTIIRKINITLDKIESNLRSSMLPFGDAEEIISQLTDALYAFQEELIDCCKQIPIALRQIESIYPNVPFSSVIEDDLCKKISRHTNANLYINLSNYDRFRDAHVEEGVWETIINNTTSDSFVHNILLYLYNEPSFDDILHYSGKIKLKTNLTKVYYVRHYYLFLVLHYTLQEISPTITSLIEQKKKEMKEKGMLLDIKEMILSICTDAKYQNITTFSKYPMRPLLEYVLKNPSKILNIDIIDPRLDFSKRRTNLQSRMYINVFNVYLLIFDFLSENKNIEVDLFKMMRAAYDTKDVTTLWLATQAYSYNPFMVIKPLANHFLLCIPIKDARTIINNITQRYNINEYKIKTL